jgi:hypothetical protein
VRAHRVGASGAGPRPGTEPADSTRLAASQLVSFWCHAGHVTTVRLVADIAVPQGWECARCGAAAGPDPGQPPPPSGAGGRGRTHLECLQMRRTPEEGAQALAEALDHLRARRESGEIR